MQLVLTAILIAILRATGSAVSTDPRRTRDSLTAFPENSVKNDKLATTYLDVVKDQKQARPHMSSGSLPDNVQKKDSTITYTDVLKGKSKVPRRSKPPVIVPEQNKMDRPVLKGIPRAHNRPDSTGLVPAHVRKEKQIPTFTAVSKNVRQAHENAIQALQGHGVWNGNGYF